MFSGRNVTANYLNCVRMRTEKFANIFLARCWQAGGSSLHSLPSVAMVCILHPPLDPVPVPHPVYFDALFRFHFPVRAGML